MKVLIRNKVILNGMFPIEGFKLDDYVQKTGVYVHDISDKEAPLYHAGHLTHALYSQLDKEDIFYEYLENDDLIEVEVSSLDDKGKMEHEIECEVTNRVKGLEKKLKLVTGLNIKLPLVLIDIYDNDKKYIHRMAIDFAESSRLRISQYDEVKKEKLANRLRLSPRNEAISELEQKNKRFKRAVDFYLDSFKPLNVGIRFTLLLSALEALFNISGKDISKTIAKYGSKILFTNAKDRKKAKWKLKEYYGIRSTFIHGNELKEITDENETCLRELVRKVLLTYYFISFNEKIFEPKDIMDFLNSHNKTDLSEVMKLYIMCLD